MGRWLVLLVIALYRRYLRGLLRRECIFAVTCSEHVRRAANDGGLRRAIHALRDRRLTCRADFSIISLDGVASIVTSSGRVVPASELSATVRKEVEREIARAGGE